jgi:hypothetical protein
MSKFYLYTNTELIPYSDCFLRGISHQLYCRECHLKGNDYGQGNKETIYRCPIIVHPSTKASALELTDEPIEGLENLTTLSLLSEELVPFLISEKEMTDNGWFESNIESLR